MTPSHAPTVTALHPWNPHIESRPYPTACYGCTVRLQCLDITRMAFTLRTCPVILSPSDPYSVVFPLNSATPVRLVADPVPHELPLSWHGIPCELIRLRIGLPVLGNSTPRPFRLLALWPTEPVEDVPPFLRLGAEFLHANGATVHLFTRPARGELVIPQMV